MQCKNCGKESNKSSKFCGFCGTSFFIKSSKSFKGNENLITQFNIRKKNIIVFSILLILGVGLFNWGDRLYNYYNIESKISSAGKLQEEGDYTGSLNILDSLDISSVSGKQYAEVTKLNEYNKKFLNYKITFDSVSLKINSSSSVADLKLAQTELQSIDASYPNYEEVKNKLLEINNFLLIALENESAANKALADKNIKAANSAQAAKNKAEQNAKIAADNARVEEVLKSFSNQLLTIRDTFAKSGVEEFINYMKAYNNGDYNLAKVYAGGVISVCYSTQVNSKALRNNFSGLPVTYENAAINLEWAGYYLCEALSRILDDNIVSSQSASNLMFDYYEKVDNFLGI